MNHNASPSSALNLAALAAQIATALPGSWTAKPAFDSDQRTPETCPQILTRTSDGLALWVSGPTAYDHKGKVKVSLNRPRDAKGHYLTLYPATGSGQIADPSAQMSETKSAEQMAADITRRLLPDAETVYALAVAKVAKENAYESAQLETLRAVCAAIGKPVEKGHNGELRRSLYVPNPTGTPYSSLASVEVRGPESAHFTIDTNRAQALALIAFLQSPAYLATVPARD